MLIRKLLIHERPLFVDHLKRLTPHDRQFRFAHAHVSDEIIERYVAGIAADDLILGCFAHGCMVGAAHVAFAGDLAEVGVSVDPDHRTQGIGAELFQRSARWARNRHAGRLYTLCRSDNRSMMALASKQGMTIHRESGTAEAFLALAPPDLLTVSDELSVGMQTVFCDWSDAMRTCRGVWMG
ncbi:MAG: GNAT family N-acetyltransferase [Magnetospirillum sp.]|nr:GNAT family N-acetyltransferase [Magnetospirillum sp.]